MMKLAEIGAFVILIIIVEIAEYMRAIFLHYYCFLNRDYCFLVVLKHFRRFWLRCFQNSFLFKDFPKM